MRSRMQSETVAYLKMRNRLVTEQWLSATLRRRSQAPIEGNWGAEDAQEHAKLRKDSGPSCFLEPGSLSSASSLSTP